MFLVWCFSNTHDHLINNDIVDNFQSVYKAGHSCETALLSVYNDIVTTIRRGTGAMLVLLDLSAAFDTIDYENFFCFLEKYVGICGNALLLLLVSLHHTFVIHCFTHLGAVSLYISRSSVVHDCGRSGQFSKCSIVCGSSVQSHVVSSSQYPHLFILYLHLPTLVLSLLRHCHSHHGNEDPVANDSDGVMFSCVGVDCRWLVHEDNLFSEGLHVMGWTECTKLFLDLRRFVGAIWPYRECLLSVVCLSLSLWEMVLLLIVGGAIPASW